MLSTWSSGSEARSASYRSGSRSGVFAHGNGDAYAVARGEFSSHHGIVFDIDPRTDGRSAAGLHPDVLIVDEVLALGDAAFQRTESDFGKRSAIVLLDVTYEEQPEESRER
jgi:hypothetical protein